MPLLQTVQGATSSGKVVCTIFQDAELAEGVLMTDFMPHKETVTGVYYAELLHKLHLAMKKK